MNRKFFRKLLRDPVAYCLDSKHALLRAVGQRAFAQQTKRYQQLGMENAHRKITVVMTAFNTGDLIERAVASVLAQTHENFELMIIDDASTDNTNDVLAKLADQDTRISVFRSPVNHGTYWSKNWCLSHADGEFVTFHDSDDISDPMRLQMQLGAMLDGGGVVAATCRWNRVDPAGNDLIIDGQSSRSAMISLMIRRKDVLERIGYFDTVRIAADTEFGERISRAFGERQLRPMRHVLYTGLLRDQSLTRGEKGGFIWQAEGNNITRTMLGDRAAYTDAFRHWQRTTEQSSLKIEFPQLNRPFAAPSAICEGCNDRNVVQVVTMSETGK